MEAYQILRVLKGLSKGWKNHPAVLMWVGHEAYLSNYIDFMCEEWKKRGFKDSVSEKARLLQPWTGGASPPVVERPQHALPGYSIPPQQPSEERP